MKSGILYIKKTFLEDTIQELTLPVFHEDREFVNTILTEAMEIWRLREKNRDVFDPAVEFYKIADAFGRDKVKSHIFIGPESTYESLDTVLINRPYVFSVDFENQKIVCMK